MLGVIGGSGFYHLDGVEVLEELKIETPYGETSDAILKCQLEAQIFYFLPRHGRGHYLSPSEIPVRANIWALKSLGVTRIFSLSAVGSLKEELSPGTFVLPSQFFDRTKKRKDTFFEKGTVAHVSFAEPTCFSFRNFMGELISQKGWRFQNGGTYVCIEGPQFSTKAESHFYRSFQFDVIGMTALTEAKLAREAQICYCLLALVTDYDVWKEGMSVTVEEVMKTMKQNVDKAQQILKELLIRYNEVPSCESGCRQSLKNAIMTREDLIPENKKKELEILLK